MIDHSTDRLEQLSSGQLTMLAVIALLAIAAVAGLFLDYTAPGASAVAPGSALSASQQPGGVEPPVVFREAPGAAQPPVVIP